MSRNGSEPGRARAQESRQTLGSVGLDTQAERAITALIERTLRQHGSEQANFIEKVQALLGERPDKAQAALRRGELLLNLPRVPYAAAAPTKAEFDALVDAYNNLVIALADLARK